MARLASQEKMGYYPTPPSLLPLIASYIKAQGPASVLDPCAGEGEAVSFIARYLSTSLKTGLGAKSYAVELDRNRGTKAKGLCDSVLIADAFRTRISDRAFSVLMLNPPYDWEVRTEGEKAQRIETQFLTRFTPKLVDVGILIYIIPFYVLKHSAKFLARQYEKINLYKFPQGEYEPFHQIVLFGVKKAKPLMDEELSLALEETSEGSLGELCFQERSLYLVPQSSSPQFFFSMDISPEECMEYVKDSPLWESFWRELDLIEEVRPIMPLRKGHLALLLASGYLDGRITYDGYDLVLKGKTCRVTDSTEEVEINPEGKIVKVTREVERIEVSIEALDLRTGEFFTIS